MINFIDNSPPGFLLTQTYNVPLPGAAPLTGWNAYYADAGNVYYVNSLPGYCDITNIDILQMDNSPVTGVVID